MAQINRASLPEEFFDVTSPRLLVQPDPAFFHAQLYKMSMGLSLLNFQQGGPVGLALPGRQIPDTGAPYTSALYDRLQLMPPDPSYAGAVLYETALGQAPGHTVRLNRPKFSGGGYTLGQREIAQGSSISQVAVDLGSEQVALTIKRYGGPFDVVNGNVAPYNLDRFDSSMALHSISSRVGKDLQRDLDKWLDQVMIALGNLGTTVLWPQGFSSDATSSQVGDMPGDLDTVFRVEENLKNAGIPRFPNGKYMGVISATYSRQLKSDPQFLSLAKDNPYAGNTNPLFQNFLARIGGIDLFESTSLIATSNANGIPINSSQFFGPNAWGSGMGGLPQIRANANDNYGESALLIWLWYMALSLMDARFVVCVHTS